MDALNLQLPSSSFDIVLDKATTDTILCNEQSFSNIEVMLKNVMRVLSPGGIFISISHSGPKSRLHIFKNIPNVKDIIVETIAKYEGAPKDKVSKMQYVVEDMLHQMKRGLDGKKASLMMIPSYTDVQTGEETGQFMAIDFGGTNFRCVLLKVDGNHIESNVQESMKVDIKTEKGDVLFTQFTDFIAKFVEKNIAPNDPVRTNGINTGFTFSFPIRQTSISEGVLIRWTKEFVASGVEGHDVVSMLQNKLNERNLKWIRINALCNDTVGTLCAGRPECPFAEIGVIVGTGTNACYREPVQYITKLSEDERRDIDEFNMIINMEWGGFDGFPSTECDDCVNNDTRNLGEQRLEKQISGRYLAMLVSKCLNRCIQNGWILRGVEDCINQKVEERFIKDGG
ncbi:MAG: Hexokinase, partial [Streblomastix strix]